MPIKVIGVPQAQTYLAGVVAGLADPRAAHDTVARLVAAAARPPMDTGRLARSVRPFPGPGARVGSDVPYAALVEHRTHFLTRAAESTRPAWMAVYTEAAAAACSGG